MENKITKKSKLIDECDFCGKIKEVRRYGKDKKFLYCDKCASKIK